MELAKVLKYDILSNGAQIASDGEGCHWKTFKKGEVVMKKILLVITAVTLLLTFASSGDAWQVNFTNNCDKDVKIDVYGEHLFWKADDCRVRVSPGKSADCEMPTGICPWSIEGNVKKGHTMSNVENGYIPPIHCSAIQGVCCCWNVKVEAYKSGETCLLRIVQ